MILSFIAFTLIPTPLLYSKQVKNAVGQSAKAWAKASMKSWKLSALRYGECEEEPLAGRRRYGPIDIEPFKDVLHRADGLYPIGRQAPAAHRQDAQATFVLAEYAYTGALRRHDTMQPLLAGRLTLRTGRWVFCVTGSRYLELRLEPGADDGVERVIIDRHAIGLLHPLPQGLVRSKAGWLPEDLLKPG